MLPEDLERVKRAHSQALGLPMREREALLQASFPDEPELRREVERLLSWHDGADGFLNPPSWEGAMQPAAGPRLLGPYEILEELGRGGSAIVYLARRADDLHKKKVAVKVFPRIPLDRGSERLFRREVEALSRVVHEYVVRFIDADITPDGGLYLVMEHVSGCPLTQFCVKLPLKERLRVFQKVCTAISYAHRNLIVHRDLKPSNILVSDEGTPKVLDFGIALLLDREGRETATGLDRLTTLYASPEQIRRDRRITTASDIYSLGVLLYEIVSSRLPYSGARAARSHEVARSILESDPLPFTRNEVDAELQAIIFKSLRKDPAERYASADALSEDLERYLTGFPVGARKISPAGKLWKFLFRNRRPAFASLVLAALLSFAVARFVREKHRADRRAAELSEFASRVIEDTNNKLFNVQGARSAVAYLNERRVEYLNSLFAEEPDTPGLKENLTYALLYAGMDFGDCEAINLGRLDQGERYFSRALNLAERLAVATPVKGDNVHLLAHSLNYLGKVHLEREEFGPARTSFSRAAALLAPWVPNPVPEETRALLGFSLSLLALTDSYLDDLASFQDHAARSLAMREESLRRSKTVEKDERGLSISLWHLAKACLRLKLYREAEAYAERGFALEASAKSRAPLFASIDLNLARQCVTLSLAESALGKSARALKRADQAVSLYDGLMARERNPGSLWREYANALGAVASAQAAARNPKAARAARRGELDFRTRYQALDPTNRAASTELAKCRMEQ